LKFLRKKIHKISGQFSDSCFFRYNLKLDLHAEIVIVVNYKVGIDQLFEISSRIKTVSVVEVYDITRLRPCEK